MPRACVLSHGETVAAGLDYAVCTRMHPPSASTEILFSPAMAAVTLGPRPPPLGRRRAA
jgi:hypothetical protein